jgi:hypothetical protein
VSPLGKLGFAGVTPIDTRVAGVTFRVVEPDTPLMVAVMLVEPGLTAVTSPWEPAALLIEAIVGAEFQVTVAVRSWVVLSV